MFGQTKPQPTTTSPAKHALNIITMVSTTVICIKLALWGVLSWETSGLIMVGMCICLAIGQVYTKLALAAVAVYLLVKTLAGNNEAAFHEGLTGIVTIIILLAVIYFGLRMMLGIK